jgi:putative hydrolase of HD superfamily
VYGFYLERIVIVMNRDKEERLRKQMAFILEADKEKNILRQTHLSDHGRRENDAEHAWHMGLMAYILKEYSNRDIDLAKTIVMCLIHDIVEIEAGDTYAYDAENKKTQKDREEKAAEHIFGMLPDDQAAEMHALFEEFDTGDTPEADFARAMDNFQPLMLNDSNGGSDWIEHGVSRDEVEQRQKKTEPGSELLYRKTEEILDSNKEKGSLK